MRGLALTIIPEDRDPAISPGGSHLPVDVYFCHCGFLEVYLAQVRVKVEGEEISASPPRQP